MTTACRALIALPLLLRSSVTAHEADAVLLDVENEAACDEDAETCEAGMSLRQLRGELQIARVRRHDSVHTQDAGDMNSSNAGDDDDEEQEQDHVNASDAEDEDDDGIEGDEDIEEDLEAADLDENSTISCKANRHYCIDFMIYKDREACGRDELCRVIDAEDVNNISGKSWMCTPSQERCDEFMAADFQSVDEYPVEYADKFESELEEEEELENALDPDMEADAAIGQQAGIYHVHRRRVGGTCWLRSCLTYMRHMTCQCNEGCERYGNCCPDYDNFCGERTTTTTEIPWWLTTTRPTPPPIYFTTRTVSTTTTTTTTTTQLTFHGTSMVEGEIKTLYHTTSREVAQLIVKGGFRPGHGGWCGGAIYFIDHPHLKKSKFNPKTTKTGAIVQAQVRMGGMAHMDRRCNGHGGHGIYGAKRSGYNSLTFNPGDGDEYVIWDTQQVMSVRIYEYTKEYGPSSDSRRRYEYHIHRRRGVRR